MVEKNKYDDSAVKNEPGLYVGTFMDYRDCVAWDHIYMIFSTAEGNEEVDEHVLTFIYNIARFFHNQNQGLFNRNISSVKKVYNGIKFSGTYETNPIVYGLCSLISDVDWKDMDQSAIINLTNNQSEKLSPQEQYEAAVQTVENAVNCINIFMQLITSEENVHEFDSSRAF